MHSVSPFINSLCITCIGNRIYKEVAKCGRNKVELWWISSYMVDLLHLDHILTTSEQYSYQPNIHMEISTKYQH